MPTGSDREVTDRFNWSDFDTRCDVYRVEREVRSCRELFFRLLPHHSSDGMSASEQITLDLSLYFHKVNIIVLRVTKQNNTDCRVDAE